MSELLTVRFPSGATEFRLSDEAPAVGDLLEQDGADWVVEEVARTGDGSALVTLRIRAESLGAATDDGWPGPLEEVPPAFAS